ncbi:MAG: Uridine kinase [Tremellales sp. Tagirdzhanova-0007]|nr:MAG: Uridine kinase [Tremellales sp. Tagirdzhanova-0007]
MALQTAELRALYDLKVFVNCDSDLMLARRIKRDVTERGRQVDGILDQSDSLTLSDFKYLRFVKSAYDNFVQPSSKFADIIVPGSSNQLAIELLVTHVKRQLDSRSLRFRNKLARMGQEEEREGMAAAAHPRLDGEQPEEPEMTEGCVLLKQTNQLVGIMTILRDQNTERGDFIFYADRLSTLVVEKALELIPYRDKTVKAPTGASFQGFEKTAEELVGISILRSGGPFSHGLRRVIRDVPIGAMLIQSDPKTGEPLLLSSDLPQSIKSGQSENVRVLLLDSQMGTGAAAMMAIRVLLDHGVPETNIIFLAYLIARRGSQSVHRAFPKVKIVTAAIDTGLEEMRVPMISPSMGEAVAEADFATRAVSDNEDADGDLREDELRDNIQNAPVQEGYRLPVKKGTEELMFSRKTRADAGVREKRAWAISPGMGHIGDRYYTI